jgi:hypothetical protein
MRRILAAVLLLAIGAVVGGIVATHPPLRLVARTGGDAGKALYQCPMHPQIVSNEPGLCPICQMRLQRIEDVTRAPGAASRRILFYRHPMRPDVTSPTPAKDEMGMDYIPVYEGEPGAESAVPGHAAFTLSPERQQLIGVRTSTVEQRPLVARIRTFGRVAYDPGLYQALSEYREAVRARNALAGALTREAREGADALVRAAVLKLRQQGVSPRDADAMVREGRDATDLLLPGRNAWIYAEVRENDVDLVRTGQDVVVMASALPGRTFPARVVAVDPILDPTTRTARVRVAVATPDAALRPETFVDVGIDVPLGEKLAVPTDAVLHTGEREVVFVVQDEGRFEPRTLRLGRQAGEFYEVIDGLVPGERVVTSANFLIDSESRFRAALAAFGASAPAAP